MGQFREALTDADREWIQRQKVIFLATAPRGGGGHVNASPKGYDTLRVLGDRRIVMLDGRGSGCETIAHLRENGRITIMLCAFEGPPRIMRLFGRGTVHEPGSPGFDELFKAHFAADWRDADRFKLVRSIIDVQVELVGQSCGFGVPLLEYKEDRPTLVNYAKSKSTAELAQKRTRDNTLSIDGIPSLLDGTDPGAALLRRRAAAAADAMLPWIGGAALGIALALGATRCLASK
ncbi:hypothetical protein LPJ61_000494 [Coemansia biformis]|uniref:Pyridoxamine 5'-phosphate oxidase N-terminal domain-containing protein n=1 Tax=Coemansia biformis TaxID=1286918 RepID=A0A9W7YI90_9FUNG|nr:hypothetical protein LPJ61_000494 [Coemansia biformis]